MKRILNWFRLRRLEGDLDRELKYHIDRRVSDLIQSGLPEPEARRRAALELGGAAQVREEVRDVWLTRWLRDFIYDLRFSARSFLRSPSFTAATVLSLALGIGATTVIYSIVDQVLLNQHPMTVVGIAEPAFHGIDVGDVPSVWIPAVMSAQAIPGFSRMLDRRTRWVQILGRLKENVSLTQAQTGLQPWFKAMLAE